MAINEVKDDITEEDLEEFEKAQEAGEVKVGDKSDESTKETKESEVSEEEVEETESEETEEEKEKEVDEKENSEESEDSVVSTKSSKVEIKEVTGETPKERALRLEVTRLRRASREKEQKEIFKDEPVSKDSYEELKELGYDEAQINTLDRAFDIIGAKKGFVRKDQSYKEMANETLSGFIEEHPEYAPENDKDDIYWGRFNSILKSDYNLVNKTHKQLKSIFERIDRDVKEELGEKSNTQGKIEAQKQKVKSVSAGASTSSKTGEDKKEGREVKTTGNKSFISSNHPNLVFKGFDEDEVDEFTK